MGLTVLCITPWFPKTPEEQSGNFILHSVRALVKGGNRVTVLVTRPWTPGVFGLLHPDWVRPPLQMDKFEKSLNIHVVHYPSIPRNYFSEFAGPLFRLGTDRFTKELIDRFEPDLIHVHTELPAYGAVGLGRERGLPVVVTLHGINPAPRWLNTPQKREILRHTLDAADRIVLVGEPLRPHFSSLVGRDDHFRVVPNGFHLPDLRDSDENWRMVDQLRIISVSNLHEGKGIDLSIEALALLNKSGCRGWHYTIVGGGRESESLAALVKAHGLQEKITFTGALTHDRAMALLRDADLFLLPSYREAFGVAYLEAMAAGLVTIGVRGEGPSAFIDHGVTGFLLPPRDVKAIAATVEKAISDRAAMKAIALAGKQHVCSEFSWDKHAQKLAAVFREAVEKQK